MLKIEKTAQTANRITFGLSGKMSVDHLPALRRLLTAAQEDGKLVTFDLEGIGLIDRKAVTFFRSGPGARARLLHCPAFLKEWLAR